MIRLGFLFESEEEDEEVVEDSVSEGLICLVLIAKERRNRGFWILGLGVLFGFDALQVILIERTL